MEEGLIAGVNLALMAVGSGAILGVVSTIFYASLWYLRK